MVDISPEDHHASHWKSWLEDNDGNLNEDELPWYGRRDASPSYGPDIPPAAQTEAARRFVSHWLNEDNHGFVIPGTEWGRSLMHWLHILVARPAEDGRVPDPATAPNFGRAELPQEKIQKARAELEAETGSADGLTLLEQVRSRRTAPWRWVDLLAWEDDHFLEMGYTKEDIDAAFRAAQDLAFEERRAEQPWIDGENH